MMRGPHSPVPSAKCGTTYRELRRDRCPFRPRQESVVRGSYDLAATPRVRSDWESERHVSPAGLLPRFYSVQEKPFLRNDFRTELQRWEQVRKRSVGHVRSFQDHSLDGSSALATRVLLSGQDTSCKMDDKVTTSTTSS